MMLRTIREERGLTQEQIAAMIGKSTAFVSRVENNNASLTPEQISTLAEKLGVSEKWLKTGQGSMAENESSRDRRSIGERIYQVRRERKLNQTEFADLLGCSRNTISLLERRKIKASQRLIRAVAEKCGVSEMWLRTGKTKSRAEEIISWLEKNPADKETIREWLKTNPHRDSPGRLKTD